jgi:hypothetical protein
LALTFSAPVVSCVVDAHGSTTPMCAVPIPAFAEDSRIAAMVLTRKAMNVPRLMIMIAPVDSIVVDTSRRCPNTWIDIDVDVCDAGYEEGDECSSTNDNDWVGSLVCGKRSRSDSVYGCCADSSVCGGDYDCCNGAYEEGQKCPRLMITIASVDPIVVDTHTTTTPISVALIPGFAMAMMSAMLVTRKARNVPRLMITIASVVSIVVDAHGPITPMCAAPIPALVSEPMIAAMVLTS